MQYHLVRISFVFAVFAILLIPALPTRAGEICENDGTNNCQSPTTPLTTNNQDLDTGTGAVSTTNINASGDLGVGGDANVTGDLAVDNVNATGDIDGVNLNAAGDVNAVGDVTATGDINGTNVNASGDLAVGGDATVTGDVNAVGDVTSAGTVTGDTLTDGTAVLNGGSLNNAINITASGTADVGALSVTNGGSVGGNFLVGGASTLDGGLTVNSGAVINDGATISDGTSSAVVDATSGVSLSAQNAGNTANVAVTGDTASVTVDNGSATHGLVVGPVNTTLSGGTTSTTLVLDDAGAHLDNQLDMGGNRVSNLAPAQISTDAVNLGQMKAAIKELRRDAMRGIAITQAMEVMLPDPDKSFRLNGGLGFYDSEQALGLSGAGRVMKNGALYLGVGADVEFKRVGGKAGFSWQW